MPAPGGPIPEGMVGPIKARGTGDQPSAMRRMVPGRQPAALPTTGRLAAAGWRQGRQGFGQGTRPDTRWRSGGFRAARNRRQDAPSAEGESRSGSCLRQGRGGRRMRTREVGLSRRLRRRTGICPEGTSVRRHWPLWPGKVSKIPFREEQDGPGWRPPSRAVRDEGVPAGAGATERSPILRVNQWACTRFLITPIRQIVDFLKKHPKTRKRR